VVCAGAVACVGTRRASSCCAPSSNGGTTCASAPRGTPPSSIEAIAARRKHRVLRVSPIKVARRRTAGVVGVQRMREAAHAAPIGRGISRAHRDLREGRTRPPGTCGVQRHDERGRPAARFRRISVANISARPNRARCKWQQPSGTLAVA
jgi:hypothetical protein